MIRIVKHIIALFMLAVALMPLAGCTHNNGDIGPWFGTWKLDAMTIDGVPDTEYDDNVIWKFQANLMSMIRLLGNHEQYEMYGTWCQPSADVLRIEYIYSDDDAPEGSMKYSPLPETHLPPGVSDLTILKLDGKQMRLEYRSADGVVYGYKLTKW